MKILLLSLLLATSALAQAHEFQFDPRAETVNTVLPTENTLRALLRVAISERTGAPLDITSQIPLQQVSWEYPKRMVNGERCWTAIFRYRGAPALLKGHNEIVDLARFAGE